MALRMRARALGLVAAASAALALWDPARTPLLPPCPFRTLTGLDCPLCGATRALHQLLLGHLRQAAHLNALVVLALPAAAAALALGWLRPGLRLPRWGGWAAAGVAVAFAVVRNLPAGAWLRA